MKGQCYCNGEVPNCPYKSDCYKTGGTCICTTDIKYVGKCPNAQTEWKEKSNSQEHSQCMDETRGNGFVIKDTGRRRRDEDNWIERQNKRVCEYAWIIFVSMITALLTTLSIMSAMSLL